MMQDSFDDHLGLGGCIDGVLSAFDIGVPDALPRTESGLSDLSEATTVVASPTPALTIPAFCMFNSALVHLDYPAVANGWTYRPELGSHSSLRWDLGNDVCMLAKHTTCTKAMRPKLRPCRNCENKKIWRRECQETSETFFVFALHDSRNAANALAPLVRRTLSITPADALLYSNFAPKAVQGHVRNSSPERVRSMMQKERNLRMTLLNANDICRHASENDLLQLRMDTQADEAIDAFDAIDALATNGVACAHSARTATREREATPPPSTAEVVLATMTAEALLPTPPLLAGWSETAVALAAPQAPLLGAPVARYPATSVATAVALWQ